MSTDMLKQHLDMAKNMNSNSEGKSKVVKKIIKKDSKQPDSYVQQAKTLLKVREDQVKQYTNMLSTGTINTTHNFNRLLIDIINRQTNEKIKEGDQEDSQEAFTINI